MARRRYGIARALRTHYMPWEADGFLPLAGPDDRHSDAVAVLLQRRRPEVLPNQSPLKAMEGHMSQETRQHANEEAANQFLDRVHGSGFWESIDLRLCAVRADSDACRSPIPIHADHRFQCMPISDSDACRSPLE